MSADNWAICPRCHEKYVRMLEESGEAVGENYGKILPEEYIRLLAENDRLQSQEEPRTLREDYGQGINEDGWYFLNYSGECYACNWRYTKKISERVYSIGE